jgi:ribosomal protein S18 acetylase RimI-like enzyme
MHLEKLNQGVAVEEELNHGPLSGTEPSLGVPATGIPPTIVRVAGVMLRVRQLTGSDLPAIERHLLRLGPPDRQARFLGNRADEVIRAYAHQLDPSRMILVGAFDPSRRLVGLAEAHPDDTTAEVGVSIDAAFRRRGLGRSLVWHALALAFEHGVEAAEFVFSPDNRAIVRLVQTFGGRSMTIGRMSVSLSADGAARGMRFDGKAW